MKRRWGQTVTRGAGLAYPGAWLGTIASLAFRAAGRAVEQAARRGQCMKVPLIFVPAWPVTASTMRAIFLVMFMAG
jgi:hypothetical protein